MVHVQDNVANCAAQMIESVCQMATRLPSLTSPSQDHSDAQTTPTQPCLWAAFGQDGRICKLPEILTAPLCPQAAGQPLCAGQCPPPPHIPVNPCARQLQHHCVFQFCSQANAGARDNTSVVPRLPPTQEPILVGVSARQSYHHDHLGQHVWCCWLERLMQGSRCCDMNAALDLLATQTVVPLASFQCT